jgi:hypothetical protein
MMTKRRSFNETYDRKTVAEPATREDLLGRLRQMFGLPVIPK